MQATTLYRVIWGNIGIMEKHMETTIIGHIPYLLRVCMIGPEFKIHRLRPTNAPIDKG